MDKTNIRRGRPLLDIASYARRGPDRRDRLSPAEIEQISRTANRSPEVMVKVLTKGAQNLGAVRRHLRYIGREGEINLETDDGEQLSAKDAGKDLIRDWDLDLDDRRRRTDLPAANGREPPKLVHKLMLSMPAGTPPDKVLAAAGVFGREHFALKHRYVMALHTDEPHPHVHMVIKAVSEQGVRLNIRKATLREWRQDFARYLREQGVAANATERAVRGQYKTPMRDGIYRAMRRGESKHIHNRAQAVAAELANNHRRTEFGKATLLTTRKDVDCGWRAVSDILTRQRHLELAARARRFSNDMPLPLTDKEQLASQILEHGRRHHNDHAPRSR
jgi:hypothetical protein